jgi:hypothetical protein
MAIVGSQPSRILKFRDRAKYVALDEKKRYGGINGKPLVDGANRIE